MLKIESGNYIQNYFSLKKNKKTLINSLGTTKVFFGIMDASEKGKIFVGGLSWDTTDLDLRRYFGQFGTINEAVVMKKGGTGRSRGFGFVKYLDESLVEQVVNGGPYFLDGRTIDPKICNPRILNQPKKLEGFKVFLGGLPSHITQTDLRRAFDKFGKILDVVIMYDQIKKKTRGFGFLTFEHQLSAEHAITSHFININCKRIEIKRTQPRGFLYPWQLNNANNSTPNENDNNIETNSTATEISTVNNINCVDQSQTAEELLMHLPINPCQVLTDDLIPAPANSQSTSGLNSVYNTPNIPWRIPTEHFNDIHTPPPSVVTPATTNIPWRAPTEQFNNFTPPTVTPLSPMPMPIPNFFASAITNSLATSTPTINPTCVPSVNWNLQPMNILQIKPLPYPNLPQLPGDTNYLIVPTIIPCNLTPIQMEPMNVCYPGEFYGSHNRLIPLQNLNEQLVPTIGNIIGQLTDLNGFKFMQGVNNAFINNLTINFNCDCSNHCPITGNIANTQTTIF